MSTTGWVGTRSAIFFNMSTAERLTWNEAGPYEWTRQWPRCLLLFELTEKYAASGQSQGCAKLSNRIQTWRVRMGGAPPLIDSLLAELWLTSRLLLGGELEEARHHAAQARLKRVRVERLLLHTRCAEVRQKSAELRRKSAVLHTRCQNLVRHSQDLITRLLASAPASAPGSMIE